MEAKKTQFIMFVYLEAIARDVACKTGNAPQIAREAMNIPEQDLPPQPVAAAMVFVRCHTRNETPFKWMRKRHSRR